MTSYSTSDLIAIAQAIGDIEKGFGRARRRNSEIEVRIDSVPIYLRGSLVGYGVRDDATGRLSFSPLTTRTNAAPAEPQTQAQVAVPVIHEPTPAEEAVKESEVIVVEEKPFGDIFDPLSEGAEKPRR